MRTELDSLYCWVAGLLTCSYSHVKYLCLCFLFSPCPLNIQCTFKERHRLLCTLSTRVCRCPASNITVLWSSMVLRVLPLKLKLERILKYPKLKQILGEMDWDSASLILMDMIFSTINNPSSDRGFPKKQEQALLSLTVTIHQCPPCVQEGLTVL